MINSAWRPITKYVALLGVGGHHMHTIFKVIKIRDMSYLVNSISNEKGETVSD